MHLVGFIIRIYHDAQSPERQIIITITIITPDDEHRNCPKHAEFYSKNKFEKFVNLVGFIIRIYHDAQSPERQIIITIIITTPDDEHRNCPKHAEFYSKNKFEKLVNNSWFYYKNLSRCAVT